MTSSVVTVADPSQRPTDHRSVPVLSEPDLGHYREFGEFLAASFGLDDDPLGTPGLLLVDGRVYELVFLGRSGVSHPAGVQVNALVPGLEPMDDTQVDHDLWAILHWLVDGVGGEWTGAALDQAGRIYRIPAAAQPDGIPERT